MKLNEPLRAVCKIINDATETNEHLDTLLWRQIQVLTIWVPGEEKTLLLVLSKAADTRQICIPLCSIMCKPFPLSTTRIVLSENHYALVSFDGLEKVIELNSYVHSVCCALSFSHRDSIFCWVASFLYCEQVSNVGHTMVRQIILPILVSEPEPF